MALNCTTESLRDEIRAATEYRDRFLEHVDKLVERYTGRYYRSDKTPDRAITENHAYEFLSIMLPSIVYDDPRVKVRAASPQQTDAFGATTMGERAAGIEAALNHWSINDEISAPLSEGAVDFYFAWSVFLVTLADQPGFQGVDMVPVRPYLMRLSQRHFFMDVNAKTYDPLQLNGPRMMGHMWKSDREDLLDDPSFDPAEVEAVALDTDLDKYDPERERGTIDIPTRDEIVCWDIWVPEKDIRYEQGYDGEVPIDAQGYNGTIYTIAANSTKEGVSKKTRTIRKPRPAYCPPWGNYVVSGYLKVPDSPYPLSPLVATAEQAEEVNAHVTAAAEDAKRYKKFVAYQNENAADGERLKRVRHGEAVGLDFAGKDNFQEVEIGGVSETQYKYNQYAMERLGRVSGLSQTMRGEADAGTTATAESIAQQGSQVRINGIKRAHRRGVIRIFRTAAWYAHFSEDMVYRLGEEGSKHGLSEFRGGLAPGMEDFNFFDLTLSIEPYSMEHTDEVLLQRRMNEAWTKLVEVAPIMATTPYIKWQEPLRAFFEVLNLEDADQWIDAEALTQMQVLNAEAQMGPPTPPAPGMAPGMDPGVEGGPEPAPEGPAMTGAREQGAVNGAAHRAG